MKKQYALLGEAFFLAIDEGHPKLKHILCPWCAGEVYLSDAERTHDEGCPVRSTFNEINTHRKRYSK